MVNLRSSRLKERILNRDAKISVIGQGYIGLPIALLLADSGFKVIGYDVNPEVVEELSRGRTRMESERGVRDLLVKNLDRNYFPTNDDKELIGSDIIIVAVPTPRKNGSADLSMVVQAVRLSVSTIERGGLIVIESTLPPKAFETVVLTEVRRAGLSLGEDIFVSYCPERAMPGNLIEELIKSYRVIGAIDSESSELSKILYKSFVNGDIEVADPLTAEIAKLVENSYRDVNIAFANEVAKVCEKLGVDASRVREIVNKHPRVNMLVPGIGVGGSCLTKDPLFLYWASKEAGYSPELINLARNINELMPYRYADLIDRFVKSKRTKGRGRICILGVTYKGNVPDARESPASYLIVELIRRGHEVRVYDPIMRESFGATFLDSIERAVEGVDAIVVASDHDEFRKMDLRRLRDLAGDDPVLLFDGRLVLKPSEAEGSGFVYASVGNIGPLKGIIGGTLLEESIIFSEVIS